MNPRQTLGLLAIIALAGCNNTDKDVTSTNTVQTSTTTPSTSTTTTPTTSTTSTTTGGTVTSECELPTSVQGVVEAPPVTYTFEDYQPGGSTAVSVGDDYHDVSADCNGGVWTPALPLEDGLYYADCDVVLPHDNLQVQLTIATPGHITVTGQAPNLSAFADGLVFITPSVDDLAIQISSSDGTYLGFLYALDGQIAVSGSNNQFYCGLVADRLWITGDNLSVSANECARPEATQAPIILMPHLEVALGNDLSEVLPGEAVTSTATLSNPGARLLMQTVVGLENLGTTSVNVDSATVVIEALDLATNTWLPLDAPVSIEAVSNPYSGVTYPVSGDLFVGTQLDASGLATWNVQLQAELLADEILHLTDPALVGGLRTRVQFDVDNPSAPVRHLYRFGDDFLGEFTTHGGIVQDAGLTVAGVDGQMQFIDGSTVPALASILSGDEVVIDHVANALQPAPLQPGETAEAYLTKLSTLDDSQINALASARGTGGGVGTVLASQVLADTTLFLPIIDLSATVPARVVAGATLDVPTLSRNAGSVAALAVDASVVFVGTDNPVTTESLLVSGQLAAGQASFTVDAALAGQNTAPTLTWSWIDEVGGLYGPVSLPYATFVDSPAELTATLTDALLVDADGNSVFTAGDGVGYTAIVQNNGSEALTSVVFDLPVDVNSPLDVASVVTSVGTVTTAATGQLTVDVGTLNAFEGATITFATTVDVGFTGAVVTAQGTVTSDTLDPVLTDDPILSGLVDATVTTVLQAAPSLYASLDDSLLIDADGNGAVSAGDTVRYALNAINTGLPSLVDVRVQFVPDPQSTLLVGSVDVVDATVSAGNLAGDSTVDLQLNTLLAPSAGALVQFDVTVNPGATGSLLAQADLSSVVLAGVLSDDPITGAVDDATATMLGGFGSTDGSLPTTPSGPSADITWTAPEDGGRVSAPTDILATATPPPGTTVTDWVISVFPSGANPADGSEIANGVGDLPGNVGTLDPTLYENGLYTVRIRVTDSDGGVSILDIEVVIEGAMKLGSFDLAFLDAQWQNGASAMTLGRTYTTLAKDRTGDFGHGWDLPMMGPTVSTNGPLGEDGWSQSGCGGGFLFSPVCTTSSKPHLVVVNWPSGSLDVFDLEILPGNTFMPQISTVAYAARPGTTSTLSPVAGDDIVWAINPGDLNDSGIANLYDPTQFVLTDAFGTEYLLDVNDGLLQTTDFVGNQTQFTADGIFPDVGTGVEFYRDGLGRIESMLLPDGSDITYLYDVEGDLTQTVDGEGQLMDFVYDDGHRLTSYSLDGQAPIATLTYDAEGRLIGQEDATGVFVSISSDPFSFEQVTIGPDPGLTTTDHYNAEGLMDSSVLSFIDDQGLAQEFVTTMAYDADYRLVERITDTGAVESWQYDADGLNTQFVDAGGVVREWVYGPFGQVELALEGGDVVEETVFGADDRPESVYRADGTLKRRLTYNEVGQEASIENGSGQVVLFDYDGNHRVSSLTLPDYASAPDVVDVVMDGRGQLLEVTREGPNGLETTSYEYDTNGRQIAIIDANGVPMTFEFDTLGRMTGYTDKFGQLTSWTFDEAGRELTRTNRNGEVLARTYDVAGRLTTVTGPDVDKELRYDPLGRLVYGRSGNHVEERVYDGVHTGVVHVYGLDSAGFVDASMAMTMDSGGRLVTLDGPFTASEPGMVVDHAYDVRGRLTSLTEASLGAFSIGYDTSGRRTSLSRPGSAVTTYDYDDAGRLLGASTVDSVGSLVHEILTSYDARGLPETQTDAEGTHTYSHDANGRLLAVDHPAGATFDDEEYTYDSANRRTSTHRDPLLEVVYNAADQLVQDAEFTYGYDAEGRRISQTDRISGDEVLYEYNALDQMVGLVDGDTVWTFAYDAMDLRVLVKSEDLGVETYGEAFVYDLNGTVRATYDTSGTMTAQYLAGFGFGEVLARVDGSGVADHALQDRLGSTVGWLTNAGQVRELLWRDAYGVNSATGTMVNPFGYTGHAEDPTGLAWGRARCLATRTGGWTSEDPVWTESRYGYVGGRPGYSIDPTGSFTATEYAMLISLDGSAGYFVASRIILPCAKEAFDNTPVNGPRFSLERLRGVGNFSSSLFTCISNVLSNFLSDPPPPQPLV